MFGRLQCFFFGHKRGKRCVGGGWMTDGEQWQRYQCRRCGAQWTRKIRPAKEPA
jgi:transposase-like protein